MDRSVKAQVRTRWTVGLEERLSDANQKNWLGIRVRRMNDLIHLWYCGIAKAVANVLRDTWNHACIRERHRQLQSVCA